MPGLCFIILFLCTAVLTSAQSPVPEKIVAALDSFSFIRPQEKTYIQTDRNDYIAGEAIWFKTYARLDDKPTILSRVIYVELVNALGAVMEKKMYRLKEGMADGVLDIKRELPSGNYYLRCYTLWMLNFPSFVTEKKIRIFNYINPMKELRRILTKTTANINFFPEGGNLVTGLKSTLAFKALDEHGNPITVNGDIVNAKNEKVISFKSIHDGMGSFELLPNGNDVYRAIIQLPDGSNKTVTLPVVKEEGIILSVDNSNLNKAFVKVERSEKNKEKYNNLLVVAQINYKVAYMGKLNIDDGLDAVAINKKNLPPGIMQVTVLTEDGRPLAERIVFVANHTISNALLEAGLVNHDKRKKNIITLDAREFTNLQAAVAVINANSESGKYAPTILSSFLLSSDIKGYINDPGYYFKDKEPLTLQHLDLLMMINGWRRFNLEDIMASKFPDLHYPFETSLSITGKVLQSNGKSVLKAGKINLIIKGEDSTNILAEAKTNDASVFVVADIEFQKAATIHFQGTNTTKTEAVVAVTIDSTYFDTLARVKMNTETIFATVQSSPYLQQLLTDKQKADSASGKTLSEVVVRTRKRSNIDSLNSVYATDIFFNSDQTLALNPNINYYDVWQFLRMSVPGIIINQTDSGLDVKFSRYEGIDMFSSEGNASIQFFLNEIPVSMQLIESIDPSDIAIVKIFKGVSGIALGAARGAIAIYTIKGKTGRDWRKKGFDFFRRSGYSVTREFYEMDYSRINPENTNPDVRTTIYWNPRVKIKDGKAIIEFYNDDVCKKFKVVMEGMDANGKLLHAEKEIQ